MAVWLEIERLEGENGGVFPGLEASTKLRRDERAAWERYRDALRAAGRIP